MSEPRVRVYVCKPSSLQIGQRVAGWTHDQQQYLVIDETVGIYLEGVTAEDVESAITGDSDAQDDVFEAIDKATRSKAAES